MMRIAGLYHGYAQDRNEKNKLSPFAHLYLTSGVAAREMPETLPKRSNNLQSFFERRRDAHDLNVLNGLNCVNGCKT
jgi:hypothetical protein